MPSYTADFIVAHLGRFNDAKRNAADAVIDVLVAELNLIEPGEHDVELILLGVAGIGAVRLGGPREGDVGLAAIVSLENFTS